MRTVTCWSSALDDGEFSLACSDPRPDTAVEVTSGAIGSALVAATAVTVVDEAKTDCDAAVSTSLLAPPCYACIAASRQAICAPASLPNSLRQSATGSSSDSEETASRQIGKQLKKFMLVLLFVQVFPAV
jgi:hypothetical protein